MEVWNGIWKKILVWNGIWKKILVWNGRFLVGLWNGMEENCQYGIWKNRLPYHALSTGGGSPKLKHIESSHRSAKAVGYCITDLYQYYSTYQISACQH